MTNNNQTALKFTLPIYLKEYFVIPEDTTSWNKDYFDFVSGKKQTRYFRPNRKRADFKSHGKALVPLSDSDIKNFIPEHGIYILVFQYPYPAIYVGIATENSTETITSRIKKHRVKITASNVGASDKSVGGVSHTKGWRIFAPGRFDYFNGIGEIDTCQDVRLITGTFKASSGSENYKKEAEYFERMIESNKNTVLDSIISRLWPNEKLKHGNIEMITTNVSRGIRPHNPIIQLWDNKLITV
ncbi:MAG: hypothetical protein DRJ01_17585 [Bacteroidetes bacterium]|nr:MAG: hypothetical protein DRJ01_17585 [Bacteroidota bacterium]